jgi:hypothetical protein
MSAERETWVPKVHPLARDAEADDPWELTAQPVAGDPAEMMDAILQEFLWMGWGGDELFELFSNPGYPLLVQLREHFGDEAVRRRIDALIAQSGVLQFREMLVEPPADEDELDVVSIDIPRLAKE